MLLLALLALVFANPAQWEAWKNKYNQSFAGSEDFLRQATFERNLDYITAHNANPSRSFDLAMNKFGHLSHEGYKQLLRLQASSVSSSFKERKAPKIISTQTAAPDSWDWRSKGMVGSVKDEGQCSDIWALVPVDQVSSACAIQSNRPYAQASIAQIESCSTPNSCCLGGTFSSAYNYMRGHGVETDTYPYEECGPCREDHTKVFCRLTSVSQLSNGDEEGMKVSLFNNGPVAAEFDASHQSFQFYSGGIYYEPSCSVTNLDFGLLVVGYGSNEQGDYWICQNSWGVAWGNAGYVLTARNKKNNCGIATSPFTVKTSL